MKDKNWKLFVGDFETTVYENQQYTEVWASAIVELFTEDVKIFSSIDSTFNYLFELSKKNNLIISYHNLKFDGSFILDYLIRVLKLEQAFHTINNDKYNLEPIEDNRMKNNTFKYVISDMGQWYTITIKSNNHFIQFRDSLKLLPFSVKRIGQSFKTKHKKLDIEYKGLRKANGYISEKEKEYIKNDVLVVKEALEILINQNHKGLTIGSCCLKEYKSIITHNLFEQFFPNLKDIELDKEIYGSENADKYIRKSYKGGWCYLAKGKENKIYNNGITLDVNSLYPSVMSCGNPYPVGKPTFWSGDYIPDEALKENSYYFIRIKTKFKIKQNYLPFLQIKGNLLYLGTECLETSDVKYNGEYYSFYKKDDEIIEAKPTITLTCTDWKLFREHYNLIECEILDGCYFETNKYLFDLYIDKYKKIKMESSGATRELAKLFLNNLYGKMATSDNSSFKVAYLKEDETIGFYPVKRNDKNTVFIAVGSAITSYARNVTIRTAQQNYYGSDKDGFIYADTDSIHANISIENIKGVELSDNEFCKWKLESEWDKGLFVRQKTYIEHIFKEDNKQLENPYYNVKCAGMPERCKNLYIASMENKQDLSEYNEEEKQFIKNNYKLEDFKKGLLIPSKLLPKRIKGGLILEETTYEIR